MGTCCEDMNLITGLSLSVKFGKIQFLELYRKLFQRTFITGIEALLKSSGRTPLSRCNYSVILIKSFIVKN